MRRIITKSTWAEIRTAYASGIGLREIARNIGIPEGTVLARAKREGWTREIESSKALAKREYAPLAVTAVEAVARSMQRRGERHIERIAGVSERAVANETLYQLSYTPGKSFSRQSLTRKFKIRIRIVGPPVLLP